MTLAELEARHSRLVDQARRIAEAIDAFAGDRTPDLERDLPARGAPVENLQVHIDGVWYDVADAEDLTRAAIYELDLERDRLVAELASS